MSIPTPVSLRYLAASCAMAEAARGVRESVRPNWGKEVAAYLAACVPPIKIPAPWCAAFVQAMTDKAARTMGVENPLDDVAREAYVPDYHALASERGWLIPPLRADVGDLVLYSFGGRRWDHIGIVIDPPSPAGWFGAVEGNTGPGASMVAQREGDGVYRKVRRTQGNYRTAFIRWSE